MKNSIEDFPPGVREYYVGTEYGPKVKKIQYTWTKSGTVINVYYTDDSRTRWVYRRTRTSGTWMWVPSSHDWQKRQSTSFNLSKFWISLPHPAEDF